MYGFAQEAADADGREILAILLEVMQSGFVHSGAGTADDVGTIVSDVWQRVDAALPGSDFTEIWRYVSTL